MKNLNDISIKNIKNSPIGSFVIVSKVDKPVDIVGAHVFGQWRYYAVSNNGQAMYVHKTDNYDPLKDGKKIADKYLNKKSIGYSTVCFTDDGAPVYMGGFK